MNQHPNEEAQQKKPLSMEIIRQDMRKASRAGLAIGICIGLVLVVAPVVLIVHSLLTDPDATSLLGSVALYAVSLILGAAITVRTVLRYRREGQDELIIEEDTVSYIETERPCVTRNGNSIRPAHEYDDFLHFKSGREFRVQKYKYRETDDEPFLTVASAADPQTILLAYRLSEYDWQG